MKEKHSITQNEIDNQYGYMEKVKALLGGRTVKIYIATYGCQQNEADSERLAGMAEYMGMTLCPSEFEADVILVNTCAVREHAELKALSIAGQFKHLKEKNPNLLIGICGCMVSQEHRKEDIKNKYPYVDFIFGTGMLYRFPEIFHRALTTTKRFFLLDEFEYENIAENIPVKRESNFKAWLSVMYGCNNFCTYCVVPYVRGRERSREREAILAEARELIKSGYKEITLLGQNVNSYGKGLYEDYDFADLLSDICKIEGDYIIRFMTSHPKDASKKLIDVIADNPKIAKQFHLPLQSGSDRILSLMNRHYDREKYLSLIEYMKEKIPDISITTDIIVGFPGETEEDFCGTIDMLERVRYSNIYSFLYSPRKGTRAAEMDGRIDEATQKDRFERLLSLQQSISNAGNNALVGQVVRVLVEGRSKSDGAKLTGRCESNRLVHFEGEDSLIGQFCNIRITSAMTYSVFGEVVK